MIAFAWKMNMIFLKIPSKVLERKQLPYFRDWEKRHQIPKSFWKKLGEQGYLCPWVDEKYEGVNASSYTLSSYKRKWNKLVPVCVG